MEILLGRSKITPLFYLILRESDEHGLVLQGANCFEFGNLNGTFEKGNFETSVGDTRYFLKKSVHIGARTIMLENMIPFVDLVFIQNLIRYRELPRFTHMEQTEEEISLKKELLSKMSNIRAKNKDIIGWNNYLEKRKLKLLLGE